MPSHTFSHHPTHPARLLSAVTLGLTCLAAHPHNARAQASAPASDPRTLAAVQNLPLTPDLHAALSHMLERRRAIEAVAGWVPVERYTFEDPVLPDRFLKLDGVTRMEVVNARLQLTTGLNGGMLLIDRPGDDDVGIEFQARTASDKPCDMSPALAIPRGDASSRWEKGICFQFGANWNTQSFFMIAGKKGERLKQTITPGQWHTLRLTRTGRKVEAHIDGALVAGVKLTPEQIRGLGPGLPGIYVYGSSIEIREILILRRRVGEQNAADLPPLPDPQSLDALAMALLKGLDSEDFTERLSAQHLLTILKPQLEPTLNDVDPATLSPEARRRMELLP